MKKSDAERRGDALEQLQELGRANVPNAALLMGIHPHTLRKYIEEGVVAVILFGKRPWVTDVEIARFNREGNLPRGTVSVEAKTEWAPEGC
jgi:hypothetical protein